MPKAKRYIPLIVVLGLASGLLTWLLVSSDAPRSNASFEAEGIRLDAYTDQADIAWEVRAATGSVEGEASALSDVTIEFLTAPEGTLTATAGQLERSEGRALLSDGVVVERGDGLRLETDELRWNEHTETLNAESVEFSMDELDVRAGTFSYDLASEAASLGGGVHVSYAGQRSFEATGERASESAGVFALEGDVEIVESDGSRYRCGQASLATDPNGSATVRLKEDVEVSLEGGSLQADEIALEDEGVRATGNVSMTLQLQAGTTEEDEERGGDRGA